MNKKRLFSLIVLLLVILFVVIYFGKGEDDIPPSGGMDLPDINGVRDDVATVREPLTIVINTKSGTKEIVNFLAFPFVSSRDEDTYSINDTAEGEEFFSAFNIIYTKSNTGFAISLNEEPIAETRKQAELRLQSVLRLSEEEMCDLNVFVGAPVSVNEYFVGQNLGFSFCPDSVALE